MNRRDAIKATLLGAVAVALGGLTGIRRHVTGYPNEPAGFTKIVETVSRKTITEAQGRELLALYTTHGR